MKSILDLDMKYDKYDDIEMKRYEFGYCLKIEVSIFRYFDDSFFVREIPELNFGN